jgi:opacity protein-like surface antigen
MHTKRVLLASSALALLAGATEAQADGLYVSVFGGANWVGDSSANHITTSGGESTLMHWETDADTGFVLGGAVGTHLDKWLNGLRVELEASYRRNDVGGRWSTFTTDSSNSQSGPIEANLSTFAIMANVWYEHDFGWRIKPYAGGGVGWARAKFDGQLLTSSLTDTWTAVDISNDGFAWQLGLGFNYEAAPGVNVGLGYRFFEGPDFTRPFPVTGFFAGKTAAFGTLENNSHSVMVNLTVDIN